MMRYDYSQDTANEMLEKADEKNDVLISLLKRVLDGHKHFWGRNDLGYWGRAQNLEFDRTMDEIEKFLKDEGAK